MTQPNDISQHPTSATDPNPQRLSSLPADVCSAIAFHLPTKDLSALSKVSTFFYFVATHEAQFRRYVPRSGHGRSWSTLYRRFTALLRPPVRTCPMTSVGDARGLGSVCDGIVFYDPVQGRLVGLPSKWTYPVGRDMADRVFLLGARTVAVVYGDGISSQVQLDRLDALSGTLLSSGVLIHDVIPDSTFTYQRTRRQVVALSGGPQGDHLIFVRNGTVHVVRAEDGTVVRKWILGEGWWFGALVRAEDTLCDGDGDGGERIIGICRRAQYDTGGARYEVHDIIEGGLIIPRFELAENERLVDVVLSRDGTWVARRLIRDGRCAVAWASRKLESGWDERRHNLGWAGGTFAQASTEFCIGVELNDVRFMPIGLPVVGESDGDGRVMRVVYHWKGTQMESHVETLPRRVNGGAFDWARLSGDGKVLLACCKLVGAISVFELKNGHCVHTMRCGEELRELWFVGDHWVVGIGLEGQVHEWHFGRFCEETKLEEQWVSGGTRATGETKRMERSDGSRVIGGFSRCVSAMPVGCDELFMVENAESGDEVMREALGLEVMELDTVEAYPGAMGGGSDALG